MSRRKILIVDDEPDLRMALARSLKAAGYDVSVAHDGEAALAEVAKSSPDLILSDVMMPGLNGFQTTRKLKESEGSASIPVLLMSAKTDPADRFWAEEVGAVALLKKPLDTRVLVQRIEEVLEAASRFAAKHKGADDQKDEP